MKTGPDRTPLSARLQEQLQAQTDSQTRQAADWLDTALMNFRTDCERSLNDARATIASDMRRLSGESQILGRTVSRQLRSAMMLAAMTGLAVSLLAMAVSWYWATGLIDRAQRASLWQMGLILNQSNSGEVLTWDGNRVELVTCRFRKEPKPCLKLSKGD